MSVESVRIYQDSSGEWRWTAKAGNGETVADSGEAYTRKEDAERAARDVFSNVQVEFAAEGEPPEQVDRKSF
jgi:uncharacterized protein YegP (UPF0339 family)